jgi:hypothetical protein
MFHAGSAAGPSRGGEEQGQLQLANKRDRPPPRVSVGQWEVAELNAGQDEGTFQINVIFSSLLFCYLTKSRQGKLRQMLHL